MLSYLEFWSSSSRLRLTHIGFSDQLWPSVSWPVEKSKVGRCDCHVLNFPDVNVEKDACMRGLALSITVVAVAAELDILIRWSIHRDLLGPGTRETPQCNASARPSVCVRKLCVRVCVTRCRVTLSCWGYGGVEILRKKASVELTKLVPAADCYLRIEAVMYVADLQFSLCVTGHIRGHSLPCRQTDASEARR
jgi:hypothetical protein